MPAASGPWSWRSTGAAFDRVARAERERAGEVVPPLAPGVEEQRAQRARAIHHALMEYELKVHSVAPGQALGRGAGRMTAEPRRLRVPAAPEEGWLTLVLVGVMAWLMAAAIDDSGWVLGGSHLTDFLVIATLLGVAAGFLGSKIGWNRWIANLVGAIFAALIVPVLVGQVLEPGQSIGFQYWATADQSIQAWTDLIVLRLQATRAIGHHLVILGLLCWGTGQFAASAVFRHHRPLSAVVVIGAILVANMAASLHQQEFFLVLFSVAALFLLTRMHALDEQATWARRRIGDPNAVRAIYLRGGAVFILVAVLGSMTLTATARSQPLAGAWDDLKPWLLDVSWFHPAIPADARGKPRDRRRPVRPAGADQRHSGRPTAASP